jgi:hypothetical protein
MNQPTENTDPSKPSIGWNDVVAASAEAEANRVERTQTFDKILVDLTDAERAELGAQHVAADAELDELTEEKKEAMADFKARIAKVESKKREIADAITKKKAWREAPKEGWICLEIFSQNERRYLDPKTEAVLCVEAMTSEDRQLALPVVSDDAEKAAAKKDVDPAPPASSDLTDPEALLAAAQRGAEADPEDETLDNDGPSYDLDDEDDDDDDEDES